MRNILPKYKLIKSKRQPYKLKRLLTKAKFTSSNTLKVTKFNRPNCGLFSHLLEGHSFTFKCRKKNNNFNIHENMSCGVKNVIYSKTCVRQPPLKLTLVVDVERWLSYKGTCHVILLAKLHDMYLYKTDNFFHIKHYLKSVSKVALLHRFNCTWLNAGAVRRNILAKRVTDCDKEPP